MKAAGIHEFGDVDVLKHEDIETPKPKPGHISCVRQAKHQSSIHSCSK